MSIWNQQTIEQCLSSQWLGRPLHYYAATGSTNDQLKAAANGETRLPTGAMAVADYQSAGRGRANRRWESPPGRALMFSLFLRLDWAAERGNWLTMMAGLAAVAAVREVAGLDVGLKWPNDVVMPAFPHSWRKLGGILLDGHWEVGRLDWAVLGIGINVGHRAEELPALSPPASSLWLETGQPIDRSLLLNRLLCHLETLLAAAEQGHSPQPAWNEQLILLGQPVEVKAGAGDVLSGVFTGTDNWGRLLLQDNAGILHPISAGDISLRKPGVAV